MTILRTALTRVADMFAYPLRHSHYLELANPLWTSHALKARVVAVQDETADCRTLTLRPGAGWRPHRAGQFVRLGVALEGVRQTRTYSISSAPQRPDGCITVTVKAAPAGRVSGQLVRQARVGDVLALSLPQGDFVLPELGPVHPLFITGGSGVTPVMSMLRGLMAELGRLPGIVHQHYAPGSEDVIFGAELQALARNEARYRLERFYTRRRSDGGDSGKGSGIVGSSIKGGSNGNNGNNTSGSGHFCAAQLESICPDWRERDVWACGPAALLDAVEAHWHAAGLAHRLHTERFRAPLAAVIPQSAAAASAGRVHFTASGVRAPSDGATDLLSIAETAGLHPPHGCRMGICHGCNVTLVQGCVRDLRNGALQSEAGEKVQLCVCSAVGDVELAL